MNVEDVCTATQLADEIGGPEALETLERKTAVGATLGNELARVGALGDVLRALSRRAPPILEADLVDPAELRAAVAYGALTRLYRQAMTTPDSIFAEHAKTFAAKFDDEVGSLAPRLGDGDSTGSAFSYATERR